MGRSEFSTANEGLLVCPVLIEHVGTEAGGNLQTEGNLEETLLVGITWVNDPPVLGRRKEPWAQARPATPFAMGNGHLVGLVGVQIDGVGSKVVVASHLLEALVSRKLERAVLVEIQPDRGPVVLVGTAELVKTRLLGRKHREEEGHVIVVSVDPDTRVLEIVVAIEIQALTRARPHDAGAGRLRLEGNQSLDVVEVGIVRSHQETHSVHRVVGDRVGFLPETDPGGVAKTLPAQGIEGMGGSHLDEFFETARQGSSRSNYGRLLGVAEIVLGMVPVKGGISQDPNLVHGTEVPYAAIAIGPGGPVVRVDWWALGKGGLAPIGGNLAGGS